MVATDKVATEPPPAQDSAPDNATPWPKQLAQRAQDLPGPPGQFQPHRIAISVMMALWQSFANTGLGAAYFVTSPVRSIEGIMYVVQHPRGTARGFGKRLRASLDREGVVFTVVCALCMIVLPGAGLFSRLADLSEFGRKAREASEWSEEAERAASQAEMKARAARNRKMLSKYRYTAIAAVVVHGVARFVLGVRTVSLGESIFSAVGVALMIVAFQMMANAAKPVYGAQHEIVDGGADLEQFDPTVIVAKAVVQLCVVMLPAVALTKYAWWLGMFAVPGWGWQAYNMVLAPVRQLQSGKRK